MYFSYLIEIISLEVWDSFMKYFMLIVICVVMFSCGRSDVFKDDRVESIQVDVISDVFEVEADRCDELLDVLDNLPLSRVESQYSGKKEEPEISISVKTESGDKIYYHFYFPYMVKNGSEYYRIGFYDEDEFKKTLLEFKR